MEYKLSWKMRKELIKRFFKQHKAWFLGTGVFLVVGVTILLVGFSVTGWSIVEWLQSPYAVTFFLIMGVGVAFFLFTLAIYFRHKLGDH